MTEHGRVLDSLNLIYDPRSDNEDRRAATEYLDRVREQPDAPELGLALAQDRQRDVTQRYFGLSILQHCVTFRWDSYTAEQTRQIRQWIVSLAQDIQHGDALFLRNKIAQLFSDAAERDWGPAWPDFDESLHNLWQGTELHKELVLVVLEALSENVGNKEHNSGVRDDELNRYCVDIFTPAVNVKEEDDTRWHARFGRAGWIAEIVTLLRQYHEGQHREKTRECCVAGLRVLRSTLQWIIFDTIRSRDSVEALCVFLEEDDTRFQLFALEALHAVFHRTNLTPDDIEQLIIPLFSHNGITLLARVYETSFTAYEDREDPRYVICRRLCETICALGMELEQHDAILDSTEADLGAFVRLLNTILRNPSLTVSIPIIYLWTKMLNVSKIRNSKHFTDCMADLLEICSTRLLRYESIPSDIDDPTTQFLHDDIDTIPERHAFLGNYRRFCNNIIERIVQRTPFDALSYILDQSSDIISGLDAQPVDTYRTDSMIQLTAEAQCTVITTAVRSYARWCQRPIAMDASNLANKTQLRKRIEDWTLTVMKHCPADPIIQKRVTTLVIDVAILALQGSGLVAATICEQILSAQISTVSLSSTYGEAVKDLQIHQPRELQRLANTFANELYETYDSIKALVERRLEAKIELRVKLDHEAFLLTIVQRSSVLTHTQRVKHFQHMFEALQSQWDDPRLYKAVTSLEAFCALLGLQDFETYFLARNADKVQDWASLQLDAQGLAMRDSIQARMEELPLQATRSLLTVCVPPRRKEAESSNGNMDYMSGFVSRVLPLILRLFSLSHAFNNPEKWSGSKPEMRSILTRTVQDRVWQNGISSESRDDFFARVRESRTTLEGLASAVRGVVRTTRELCMWILHSLSQLGDVFYGVADLPQPLSEALYADAFWLSPHQLSALLSMSSTLIDRCPSQRRAVILPYLIVPLFQQLDTKMAHEWESLEERKRLACGEDSLGVEMKTESVLRNLSHSAVMLVSSLLSIISKDTLPQPTIRGLILTSRQILEPLALFATHTICRHDSRSSAMVIKVLRGLIPEFQHEGLSSSLTCEVQIAPDTANAVREFFCSEVLKAAITSMHDTYFVDMQQDLAALVAAILVTYIPRTETAAQVLLTLPEMTEHKLQLGFRSLAGAKSDRARRALVLDLLDGVRGVSIHEQGKLKKSPTSQSRQEFKSRMQEQFMAVDDVPQRNRGTTPEIGIADLFG